MKKTEKLSQDKIISTAEKLMKKYSPEKVTLVDIAKELGVSHVAIYRYFDNKNSLWEAMGQRWLDSIFDEPLRKIVDSKISTDEKLRDWLITIYKDNYRFVKKNPKLYAHYGSLLRRTPRLFKKHENCLIGQLAEILSEGQESGIFKRDLPDNMSLIIYTMTIRFHDSIYCEEWLKLGDNPSQLGEVIDVIFGYITKK